MTCIVGIVDNGLVYIGGDSAGSDGWITLNRADSKVFVNGEMVFGFTSSFRMGQLLAYSFTPPVPGEQQDVYAYMVTSFVDAVRECLKAGGWAKKENEQEEGGSFLIGYRGRLFCIDGDYQVGEQTCGFHSIGSGAHVALGALFATRGKPVEERILTALEAAETFISAVRKPFVIKKV